MKKLTRFAAVCTALSLLSTSALAQGADECAMADDLMSNLGSFPFDTNNCSDTMAPATTSAEQQCFSLTEDVWFRWTADMSLDNHIVRFDTCNTANYDTEIGIWEGGTCGTAVGLGCNDDFGGCAGNSSQIEFIVTGGTTYLIQLGYWSSAGGVFGSGTLQISDQGLDPCLAGVDDMFEENDTCMTASALPSNTMETGLFASQSDGDFYSIALNAGEILDFDFIETTGNGADFDVRVYDAACTLLSDNNTDGFTFASGNMAQTIVAEVYYDTTSAGGCSNYDLTTVTSVDPCFNAIDDGFEDNDTCATASAVGAGMQTGLFVSTTDSDFYAITLMAGEVATVSIVETSGNGVDLDLNGYDPGCAQIVTSTADSISISAGNTAGVYVVEVFHDGFDADPCTNYDMDVVVGPDPCFGMDDAFEDNDDCNNTTTLGESMNAGLFVRDTDEDYYSLTVADGDTLVVDALFVDATADVDIFLYQDAAACAVADPVNCTGSLACGFSASDNEQIMWTNNSGGPETYVLKDRVFSAGTQPCNTYDLNITGADGGIGTNYCVANTNSAGTMALIRAEGSDVAADQDLTLITEGVVPGVPGLYFYGPNQIQVPFGNGFRCVGGSTTRIQPPAFANGMGTTTRVLNFAAPYAVNIVSGACHNFQLWYRDNMVGAGFNLSNGLKIQFN